MMIAPSLLLLRYLFLLSLASVEMRGMNDQRTLASLDTIIPLLHCVNHFLPLYCPVAVEKVTLIHNSRLELKRMANISPIAIVTEDSCCVSFFLFLP